MPLKYSDDSLCIMESLRRSEVMGPNSLPTLENFLSGATMAGHPYGGHEKEAVLNLDSIFYSQSVGLEINTQPSLDLLQEPIRQDGRIQVQEHHPYYHGLQYHEHHPYYHGLQYHDMYQAYVDEEINETQLGNCDAQIPAMSGDELPSLKNNWVFGPYTDHHALDQQMNSTMVNDRGASGSTVGIGYDDLQSLSLSISDGSQSSCVTAPIHISPAEANCLAIETKKRSNTKVGQRTSKYKGVTRHCWTGRYEAHLWDNSCKKEGRAKRGRQVYLGGYDVEEKAARAYDLAALKYWGPAIHINFSLENYHQELEEMKHMSRQEYVVRLRRKSNGFSWGASIYRGVKSKYNQHGRWQARIGRVAGKKNPYLGTFSTPEEAAQAYDIAAIKLHGVNAITNFDISRYNVERIMANKVLHGGELVRRNKDGKEDNGSVE